MINSKYEKIIIPKNKLVIKKIFKLKNINLLKDIQRKIIDHLLQENLNLINYEISKVLNINSLYLFEPLYFYNPKTSNIIILSQEEVENQYFFIFYLIYEQNSYEDNLIIDTISNILELEEISPDTLNNKQYQKIKNFIQYLKEYNVNISPKEIELSKNIMDSKAIDIITNIINHNFLKLDNETLLYIKKLEDINFIKTLFTFECSVKNEFIFQVNGVDNFNSVLNTFLCPHCKKPLQNEIIKPNFEISIFFERFINNSLWLKNIITDFLLKNFTNNIKIYEYDKDILLIDLNSALFFIFITSPKSNNILNYFSFIKDMEILNILSSFLIINPLSINKINLNVLHSFNFLNIYPIIFEDINYNTFLQKMDFIKKIINEKLFQKNINEITNKFKIENYIQYYKEIKDYKIKEKIEKEIEKEIGKETIKEEIIEEVILDKEKEIESPSKEAIEDSNKIPTQNFSQEILEDPFDIKTLSSSNTLNQMDQISNTENNTQQSIEKNVENIVEIKNQILSETSIETQKTFDNQLEIQESIVDNIFNNASEIQNLLDKKEKADKDEIKDEIIIDIFQDIEKTQQQIEKFPEQQIEKSQVQIEEIQTDIENQAQKVQSQIEELQLQEEIQLEIEEIQPQINEVKPQELQSQMILSTQKQIINKEQLVNDYLGSISYQKIDLFSNFYSENNLKTFNEIFNFLILSLIKSLKNPQGKSQSEIINTVIQNTLSFIKSKNLTFFNFIILYIGNKLNIYPKIETFTSKLTTIFSNLLQLKEQISSKKVELLLIYNQLSIYNLLNIPNVILGPIFLQNINLNWSNIYNLIENKEVFIKYKKEIVDSINNYLNNKGIENFYILNKNWQILNENNYKLTPIRKIIDDLIITYKIYNSCLLKEDNLILIIYKITEDYTLLLNFTNIIVIIQNLTKIEQDLISDIITQLSILDLL